MADVAAETVRRKIDAHALDLDWATLFPDRPSRPARRPSQETELQRARRKAIQHEERAATARDVYAEAAKDIPGTAKTFSAAVGIPAPVLEVALPRRSFGVQPISRVNAARYHATRKAVKGDVT